MEQFLYTYLNQKYGLKTLIIEWASAVIHGVKTYLRDDHQITLFAKILKNECEEDFRIVQMQVKETLNCQLKMILRERYQNKSEKEINRDFERILGSFIDEWMWRKLAFRMFEHQDAQYLCQQLLNQVQQKIIDSKENVDNSRLRLNSFLHQRQQSRQDLSRKKSSKRLTREEEETLNRKKESQQKKLLYLQEFTKTILDFQLQEHDKYLFCFNQLFKQVDVDSDGIITEEQFRQLIACMNVFHPDSFEREVNRLLKIIDPHNNKTMTYS